MGAKKENVIGNRYNMLVVISDAPYLSKYKRRLYCVCDCGKTTISALSNLKNGHTKSCGCHNRNINSSTHRTHGMSSSPEYKSYRKMLERCYDNKEIGFHNYGGRGIFVCDRWKESFENFFEDMGHKPSKFHSIDRKNPNGNYEPGNCKWSTKKEQNGNRTNNTWIEHNGIRMIRADWCRLLNVCSSTFNNHIKKGRSYGYIIEYYKRKKNIS